MSPNVAAALPLALVAAFAAAGACAQSVVPIRAIRSQHMISAEDVELVDQNAGGAIETLEAVVGKEARVTLYPGRPILVGQVGAPAVVERNDLVRMLFRQGPLSITAEGRVLERGGAGENVKVMNLESRQIVTGAVRADGVVEVTR